MNCPEMPCRSLKSVIHRRCGAAAKSRHTKTLGGTIRTHSSGGGGEHLSLAITSHLGHYPQPPWSRSIVSGYINAKLSLHRRDRGAAAPAKRRPPRHRAHLIPDRHLRMQTESRSQSRESTTFIEQALKILRIAAPLHPLRPDAPRRRTKSPCTRTGTDPGQVQHVAISEQLIRTTLVKNGP